MPAGSRRLAAWTRCPILCLRALGRRRGGPQVHLADRRGPRSEQDLGDLGQALGHGGDQQLVAGGPAAGPRPPPGLGEPPARPPRPPGPPAPPPGPAPAPPPPRRAP